MAIIERSVVVQESILIDASPDAVWRLFSQMERWPQWNPVCSAARQLSGSPWKKGSTFEMTLKPGRRTVTFRPTVVESAPPHKVIWLVRSGGIYGQHTFTFELEGEGTRATSHEVFSGSMLWVLPLVSPERRVREIFRRWLEALKAEVERAGQAA